MVWLSLTAEEKIVMMMVGMLSGRTMVVMLLERMMVKKMKMVEMKMVEVLLGKMGKMRHQIYLSVMVQVSVSQVYYRWECSQEDCLNTGCYCCHHHQGRQNLILD